MCGAVKLTTNADPDKYDYFVMSMNLMHVEVFRHQIVVGLVKTVFGAGMSSSVHVDSRKKIS